MMHERKKYFLTLAVITALMNTGYAGVAAAEEADSQQVSEQVQTRDACFFTGVLSDLLQKKIWHPALYLQSSRRARFIVYRNKKKINA